MSLFYTFLLIVSFSSASIAAPLPVDKIQLPPGFHIDIYATPVANARQMTVSPATGIVYVGTRSPGDLYAIIPNKEKTKAAKIIVLANNLTMPNGVAYRQGSLYVAEVNRVLRFDNIDENIDKLPKPVVINDSFPKDTHHGWKFIRFSPEGELYIPVGAPCNICERDDPRYASIMRMKADGSQLRIFASGVRNTVGFDWHPVTKTLWFTDNGRDWLGDDVPPDELNHAPTENMHFGYPYVHGDNIPDPKYGHLAKGKLFTPPAKSLDAHVAPLGMTFYNGKQFPARFQQQIFIPEHGSWNRSKKSGYRVMLATVEGNKVVSYEPFATGWLQGQRVWGRPVALLPMPDGSMLLSDDYADVIYRITYQAQH